MTNLRLFPIISLLLFLLAGMVQAQWVASNVGIADKDIRAIVVSGTFVFATGPGWTGIWRSPDGGHIWEWKSQGLDTATCVWALAVSGTTLFAGSGGGWPRGVFRSTDNGELWVRVNNGLGSWDIHALALVGTDVFAGTWGAGVFRSTNNGTAWTSAGLSGQYIYTLAVNGSNLWAGTLNNGIYLSTNNGTSWAPRNTALPNLNVHSIAFIGSDVFAATLGSGAVSRSTNNGASWTQLVSWPPDTVPYVLTVVGSTLFAGTNYGKVRRSTNNGASWSDVSTGLPMGDYDIYALRVYGTDLLAGSVGTGVWRRPLSQLVSVESTPGSLPGIFSLEQNYPNPFNPTTTISYLLPLRSRVTLKVLDILGREVAVLMDGVEEPGYKSVQWDASSVASGVYFYRLLAGSFVETRRLLVLK